MLLNRPALQNPDDILPADEDLDIERGKLTRDDIRRAIKQLKHDKAAGPGGIPCEALKADIEGTVDMLHPLFERILVVEEVPRTRLKGRISYQVAKERRRHDQNKTNSAKDSSAKIGLNINSEKINTMITEPFWLDDDLLEKVDCYTSQLEYVFRLEENASRVVGQNSLTP